MSEEQSKQPNTEQPETDQLSQELTETSAVTSQSYTQQESTVTKSGLLQQVLGLVRSFLPEPIRQKTSDRLLTVAMATITTLLVVIIFVSFPSSQPATEVADVPIFEGSELTEAIALEQSLPPVVDSEDAQMLDLAPETGKNTPPPRKLTPEQTLIVSIQNQIYDLTNEYGDEVLEYLKVDFSSNLVTVEITDNWYELTAQEQDELANKMFQQVQYLEFGQLQLINSQGRIIARNSVISSKMIILERSLLERPV